MGPSAGEKHRQNHKTELDDQGSSFYLLTMSHILRILALLFLAVTLHAQPATEVKRFESDTDCMSKEEVVRYMGRRPDNEITPHLWRYLGSWTNSETMDSYNCVDLSFGMLTDSHKYGVMRYNWDVQ